jgi:hypothetical protein
MSKTRNARNALVSSSQFRLSADDSAKIAQLSVRPGKVTASGRKKTTSGVWKYFGVLCQLKNPFSSTNQATDAGYVTTLIGQFSNVVSILRIRVNKFERK